MSDEQLEYRWTTGEDGLELGLALSRAAIGAGDAVDVYLAARNRTEGEVSIAPRFSLLIERHGMVDEHGGGPRASEAWPLAPGATEALAGWHLDHEQLGTAPGVATVWVVYRPGSGPELETVHATVEVSP